MAIRKNEHQVQARLCGPRFVTGKVGYVTHFIGLLG